MGAGGRVAGAGGWVVSGGGWWVLVLSWPARPATSPPLPTTTGGTCLQLLAALCCVPFPNKVPPPCLALPHLPVQAGQRQAGQPPAPRV